MGLKDYLGETKVSSRTIHRKLHATKGKNKKIYVVYIFGNLPIAAPIVQTNLASYHRAKRLLFKTVQRCLFAVFNMWLHKFRCHILKYYGAIQCWSDLQLQKFGHQNYFLCQEHLAFIAWTSHFSLSFLFFFSSY